MPRSLEQIDQELRDTVKARANTTAQIGRLSQSVVHYTRTIDKLLAERSEMTATCPDTPSVLVSDTP